jgi:hypothetical protein
LEAFEKIHSQSKSLNSSPSTLLRLAIEDQITVLDRRKLEKLSCECYSVVKRESDRLVAIHHGL